MIKTKIPVFKFHHYKYIRKIEKKYPGYFIFATTAHVGDAYALFSISKELKKKYGDQFLLLVERKFQFFQNLFFHINKVEYYPGKWSEDIAFGPIGMFIGRRSPKKGRVSLGHPIVLELLKTYKDKGYNFFELLKLRLGVDINAKFELPTYIPENIKAYNFLKSKFEDKKIIYFFHETRVMKVTENFTSYIIKLLKRAVSVGYEIVFNDYLEEDLFALIPDFVKDKIHFLRLDLEDIFYAAEYFKNVVVFRNGVADYLTSSKSNMCVLYSPLPCGFLGNNLPYIKYFPLRDFEKRGNVLEIELNNVDKSVDDTLQLFNNKL